MVMRQRHPLLLKKVENGTNLASSHHTTSSSREDEKGGDTRIRRQKIFIVRFTIVSCFMIPVLFFLIKETKSCYQNNSFYFSDKQGQQEQEMKTIFEHLQEQSSKGMREADTTKTSYTNTNEQCTVYLAPSSLPDGGMGMFTTQNLRKGQTILPADGPQIPIIDPDYESEKSSLAWIQLFSGYWWESGITNPGLYESKHSVEYQITCGALPNSHVLLNNLDIGHPAVVPYDDSIMDRMTNPGAGAVSNYMGRHSIAAVDISAGDEIFLSYPDEYMNYISTKYDAPKREHFYQVGDTVHTLMNKYGQGDYQVWKDDVMFQSAQDKVKKILPKSQDDLDRVLSMVKDINNIEQIAHAVAKEISVERRSVEWIQKNGLCLDNIVPKVSSNPRAGKGAFAQRFIPKGDIVVPAPLLQITDRNALRIPAFKEDSDKWQLLLNYCLGHDDTSLLLCPNTNAILLNHCSHRRPDEHPCSGQNDGTNEPNAFYRWAKWDNSTDNWLNKTVSDIQNEGGRGLSLEFVAARDILPGEEIFIDYGESWEKAWDQHVLNWKPPHYENTEWTNIKQLNDELKPIEVVPDWKPDPILDNRNALFTGCFYFEDDESIWEHFESGESWKSLPLDKVINEYGMSYGAEYQINENDTYTDGDFWPCVVIGKEGVESDDTKEDKYTVRIMQSKNYEETLWTQKKLPRIISDYPRSSIRHFYLPYKSDIHLPGAFRHHIELSDSLIPLQWKDRIIDSNNVHSK